MSKPKSERSVLTVGQAKLAYMHDVAFQTYMLTCDCTPFEKTCEHRRTAVKEGLDAPILWDVLDGFGIGDGLRMAVVVSDGIWHPVTLTCLSERLFSVSGSLVSIQGARSEIDCGVFDRQGGQMAIRTLLLDNYLAEYRDDLRCMEVAHPKNRRTSALSALDRFCLTALNKCSACAKRIQYGPRDKIPNYTDLAP